jgi:hypothetical protein
MDVKRALRRGYLYAEITCPAMVSVTAVQDTLASIGIHESEVKNNSVVQAKVDVLVVPALYWRLPLLCALTLRG